MVRQPIAEGQDPTAQLLPARHPKLRDAAVILAIISTVCYFAFTREWRALY